MVVDGIKVVEEGTVVVGSVVVVGVVVPEK